MIFRLFNTNICGTYILIGVIGSFILGKTHLLFCKIWALRHIILAIPCYRKDILVDGVSSIRCYICGPNIHDQHIPSCDNFDPAREDIYTKDCSSEYKSCSIQKIGAVITRSCEDIKINDCKTANNVEYCYCSENLCNTEKLLFKNLGPPDDEDVEGSGDNTVAEVNTTSVITTKASTGSSFHWSPILIVSILTQY